MPVDSEGNKLETVKIQATLTPQDDGTYDVEIRYSGTNKVDLPLHMTVVMRSACDKAREVAVNATNRLEATTKANKESNILVPPGFKRGAN